MRNIRCHCGAEFAPTDLGGNPRTQCPICRKPLASQPSAAPIASPPPPTSRQTPPVREQAPRRGADAAARPVFVRIGPAQAAHLPSVQNDWIPPPGLCDHTGQQITMSKRFAWGPPAEIGDVLSADTNQAHDHAPSFALRWLLFGSLLAAVYLIMGELVPRTFGGVGNRVFDRIAAVVLGALAGLIGLAWTWPAAPHCTYLGSYGAALLTGRWGRPELGECQMMLFQDDLDLYSAATHLYKNFIYQDTYFHYQWFRPQAKRASLTIAGSHNTKDQLPPPDSLYHFGVLVENCWLKVLFHKQGPSLAGGRSISFPYRSPRIGKAKLREIRLSAERIEFVYGHRSYALEIVDIGLFEVEQGAIRIEQHGASTFSLRGRYYIFYRNLGNAQLFVHYLAGLLSGESFAGSPTVPPATSPRMKWQRLLRP